MVGKFQKKNSHMYYVTYQKSFNCTNISWSLSFKLMRFYYIHCMYSGAYTWGNVINGAEITINLGVVCGASFDTAAFSMCAGCMKMCAVTASPPLQEVLAALTQKIICLPQCLEALQLLPSMHVNK
jgi:hypothetical protein